MISVVVCLIVAILVVLSFRKYRELPLLAVVAIQPLKQYLLTNFPLTRRLDPTLCVCMWMVGLGLVSVLFGRAQKRGRNDPFHIYGLQVLLSLWVLLTLAWTPAPTYGAYKGLRFALLNTSMLVAPFVLVPDLASLRRLTIGLAATALIVYGKIALWPSYAVPMFADDKFFRAGFIYGNDAAPNALVFAGAFFIGWAFSAKQLVFRWLCIAPVPLLMLGAWTTGTRASVVSILLASAATVMIFSERNKLARGLGLIIVLVAAMGFAYNASPELQQQRIVQGLTSIDASGDSRLFHWQHAIEAFTTDPIGRGIGSYATFSIADDTRWFPHNILLEAAAELGIVGLGLLLGLFWMFARYIWLASRTPMNNIRGRRMADMWLVGTLCAAFSGLITDDLADNRAIWLGMGMTIVAYRLALHSKLVLNWKRMKLTVPKSEPSELI